MAILLPARRIFVAFKTNVYNLNYLKHSLLFILCVVKNYVGFVNLRISSPPPPLKYGAPKPSYNMKKIDKM